MPQFLLDEMRPPDEDAECSTDGCFPRANRSGQGCSRGRLEQSSHEDMTSYDHPRSWKNQSTVSLSSPKHWRRVKRVIGRGLAVCLAGLRFPDPRREADVGLADVVEGGERGPTAPQPCR